jgi:aspartyl-tRNA(Asn)/glutamyl-tRNA(Gln) amidotransferase subunit A
LELIDYSVKQLVGKIKAREVTSREVTEEFIKSAKAQNPKINAFVAFNDKAISSADLIDERLKKGEDVGLLAGVPIGIKDMLCTEGLGTTACSRILENFVPPYSATVVRRLEDAGGITLGKLNCDEFAMGSSNENSLFGPCRNPWNSEYVPGGSSGGSAAAVAARMAPASIGTDTGGSIRQPASFCGVVGVKPTYGRVSRYGIIAFASSLDQAGPMAATVEDCALLLDVICGPDKMDSTTSERPSEAWSTKLQADMRGMKIGLPREHLSQGLDSDVERVVTRAVDCLREAGAEVVDVTLPLTQYAVSIYYLVAASEASSNLARYDGIRFGYRTDLSKHKHKDLTTLYEKTRGEGFSDEVKRRIMLGTYALSSGYYDAYYKKACQVRRLIQQDYDKAFSQCDFILGPVSATPAFKIGEKIDDPLAMYLNDIYTTSANLAGIPGMSVPGGFTSNGLPVGVQIMAPHFQEQVMLNAGYAIEQSLKTETRSKNVPC